MQINRIQIFFYNYVTVCSSSLAKWYDPLPSFPKAKMQYVKHCHYFVQLANFMITCINYNCYIMQNDFKNVAITGVLFVNDLFTNDSIFFIVCHRACWVCNLSHYVTVRFSRKTCFAWQNISSLGHI